MSTDWIKMRVDLREDPAVFRLSKLTKLDRLSVVGRLWAFWAWADKHAIDGRIAGSDAADVDEITDRKGFSDALRDVGWLEIGEGFVAIPKHDRHTGESAKERSLKNARQARWRQSRDADVDGQTPTGETLAPSTAPPTNTPTPPSTPPSTRVEKSREEKEKENPPASRVPPAAAGQKPKPAKRCPESFEVTPALLEWARQKAPAIDIDRETEAFRDWTFKDAKTDWPSTWRTWMRKATERAMPQNGRGPGLHQPTFRERDMAAKKAEAAAWMGSCAPAAIGGDFIDMEVGDVTRLKAG